MEEFSELLHVQYYYANSDDIHPIFPMFLIILNVLFYKKQIFPMFLRTFFFVKMSKDFLFYSEVFLVLSFLYSRNDDLGTKNAVFKNIL